ncbi:uncharacterized protein LOC116957624 [Petromyzon marinus]|uniref:uncharacterized protein LOC116957624 n=1 Tax=Petromyzon marinus TaxID=7757 RepID=UPI003F72EA0E
MSMPRATRSAAGGEALLGRRGPLVQGEELWTRGEEVRMRGEELWTRREGFRADGEDISSGGGEVLLVQIKAEDLPVKGEDPHIKLEDTWGGGGGGGGEPQNGNGDLRAKADDLGTRRDGDAWPSGEDPRTPRDGAASPGGDLGVKQEDVRADGDALGGKVSELPVETRRPPEQLRIKKEEEDLLEADAVNTAVGGEEPPVKQEVLVSGGNEPRVKQEDLRVDIRIDGRSPRTTGQAPGTKVEDVCTEGEQRLDGSVLDLPRVKEEGVQIKREDLRDDGGEDLRAGGSVARPAFPDVVEVEVMMEHVDEESDGAGETAEQGRHRCSVCAREFSRKRGLQVHTWQHSSHRRHRKKALHCDLCAYSTRLKSDLERHLRTHHDDDEEEDEEESSANWEPSALSAASRRTAPSGPVPRNRRAIRAAAESGPIPNNRRATRAEAESGPVPNNRRATRAEAESEPVPNNRRATHSSLRRHRKKALQCDLCAYRTRLKSDLERHLWTHLDDDEDDDEEEEEDEESSANWEPSALSAASRRTAPSGPVPRNRRATRAAAESGPAPNNRRATRAEAESRPASTDRRRKAATAAAGGESVSNNRRTRRAPKKTTTTTTTTTTEEEEEKNLPQAREGTDNGRGPAEAPRRARLHDCPACGKAFSRAAHLRRHSRVHATSRPHVCPECGKAFAHADDLSAHARVHAADPGGHPNACARCGARFRLPSHLLAHERTHTGERPFACARCGRAFAHASTLRRHERAHAGERPHRCDTCGALFSRESHLRRHRGRRHARGRERHACALCPTAAFYSEAALARHEGRHLRKGGAAGGARGGWGGEEGLLRSRRSVGAAAEAEEWARRSRQRRRGNGSGARDARCGREVTAPFPRAPR